MNSKIATIIVILVVIGGALYLLIGRKSQTMQSTNQMQVTQPTLKEQMTTVNITAAGFDPQTLTVKAGTRVVWTNKSGQDVSVASDNHPTHLLYPPLNLGTVANGSSLQLVFGKPGKYTYHNHLNPVQKGAVVVQ